MRPTNPPPKPKRSLTNHDPESIKTHLSNYSIKNSPIHSRQSSAEVGGDRPSMNLAMASFDLAEKEASKIHNNSSLSADFDRKSAGMSADFDRKSAGMSADFDRKSAGPSADYDRKSSAVVSSNTGNGSNADYVNVNVRDGHIALAQRKLSEASMNFPGNKTRERRNSFREAMEKSDNKSYEPIWFDQAGESTSHQSVSLFRFNSI